MHCHVRIYRGLPILSVEEFQDVLEAMEDRVYLVRDVRLSLFRE